MVYKIILFLVIFYTLLFSLIFYLKYSQRQSNSFDTNTKDKQFIDKFCKIENNCDDLEDIVNFFEEKNITFKYDDLE